jgi:hypothetical protein
MQRGFAFAWRRSRARKRRKCQGSGGRLDTDAALVFWDAGNCLMPLDCQYNFSLSLSPSLSLSHPIACSARSTSVTMCARPVSSLCMAPAAAALVICACVRSVCLCVPCGGI